LDAHYAGAVDDQINARYVVPFEDGGGCFADGFLAREVDLQDAIVDLRIRVLEGIDALLDFCDVSAGDDDSSRRLRSLEVLGAW
jgi:hypothetical protein